LIGSVDVQIFSTGFLISADGEVVTKSLFRSADLLSIFAEYNAGDDGVRV
jgi:hypothetical protein